MENTLLVQNFARKKNKRDLEINFRGCPITTHFVSNKRKKKTRFAKS